MRKPTYRIDLSEDLWHRIRKEAALLRPASTIRAVTEQLLWDALSAADYRRTRAEAATAAPEFEPRAVECIRPEPPVAPRRGNLYPEPEPDEPGPEDPV